MEFLLEPRELRIAETVLTRRRHQALQPVLKHDSAPDGALEHRIEVPVLSKLIAILTTLLLSAAVAL